MEENFDEKLYKEYLNGEKEAFGILYDKYNKKIKYFIYNIIKDYQKSEDIMQEVFIYIMQNKLKEGYSFKYYLYLVAKSKALNYINTEKRRNTISQKYVQKENAIVADIAEIITKEEEKKQLIEAINMLDDKYKNAIYLVKIEELSYKETAEILGESLSNVKTLVHRGKKILRKILLKKGFDDMKKPVKVLLIIFGISIVLSGLVYAGSLIYKNLNKNNNITFNQNFESTLDENTINNIWIGTLDLAWKDLEEKLGKEIILEENVDIANKLNESKFSKEMLDTNDYEIKVTRTITNSYNIDAKLKKNLNFLSSFDNFSNISLTSFQFPLAIPQPYL